MPKLRNGKIVRRIVKRSPLGFSLTKFESGDYVILSDRDRRGWEFDFSDLEVLDDYLERNGYDRVNWQTVGSFLPVEKLVMLKEALSAAKPEVFENELAADLQHIVEYAELHIEQS